MTMASSGALAFSSVLTELDFSAGTTFNMGDDRFRWLADDTSGAIAMSSLYSKRSLKLVDSGQDTTQGASLSLSLSRGTDFTSRQHIVCIAAYNESGNSMVASSVTFGGVAVSNITQVTETGGAGAMAFIGNLSALSGTGNATLSASFNNQYSRCYAAILSGSGINSVVDSATLNGQGSNPSGSMTSGSNDYMVQVACRKTDGSDVIAFRDTSLTEIINGAFGNGHVTIGISTRNPSGSQSIGWTGDAASYRYASACKIYG